MKAVNQRIPSLLRAVHDHSHPDRVADGVEAAPGESEREQEQGEEELLHNPS